MKDMLWTEWQFQAFSTIWTTCSAHHFMDTKWKTSAVIKLGYLKFRKYQAHIVEKCFKILIFSKRIYTALMLKLICDLDRPCCCCHQLVAVQ